MEYTRSHLSKDMHELLYRYLGEKFMQNPADPEAWKQIDEIPMKNSGVLHEGEEKD